MLTMAHEQPCAAPGLLSYRYRGPWLYIMIGATDDADALREAQRSLEDSVASVDRLEIWDVVRGRYVPAPPPAPQEAR